jgi:hypothetical protein
MSVKTVRRLLVVAAALIVWGPPALRSAGRDLDAALADPFALDPAAIFQVGSWALAMVLAVMLVMTHVARRTRFLSDLLADRPVRWYGLYGLLGLISVVYSSAPFYTAYFAHKIVVGIFVLALLEWHWPASRGSRALQVLFWVYGLQAAAIGILYYVDRELVIPFGAGGGEEPARVTGGIFSDYGASALIAGIYFLTVALFGRRPAHRWAGWAAYLASWWLIVLSQTRSTMAAAVVILVIMLHAHPRARVVGTLAAAGAAIGLVTLLPSLLTEMVTVGTRRGEGLETLSGRTEAFAYLIGVWQQSPLYGFGFAAGTRNALIPFIAHEGLNIGSGHDALSTVLVDVGLIGLLFLTAALASAWIAVARLYRASRSVAHVNVAAHQVAAVLLWVTFHGIVDKSMAGPYLVFVAALVALWALRKQLPAGGPESAGSAPAAPTSAVAGRRAHP